MKIICDIAHPAHVNFLKFAIHKLSKNGHEVIITCLVRGTLPNIVAEEFPDNKVTYIGKHTGSKLSIIFNTNIRRFVSLFRFLMNQKTDIGISVGSFTLGLALKFLGKPNLQFDDDPERRLNVFLEKLTSTELFFPPVADSNGKVQIMNALKEWAYLSPEYFSPNAKEVEKYKVKPHGYIFIREISSKSLNYARQPTGIIAGFAHKLPRTYRVVLSLEDKTTIDRYPSDWIVLQEPIDDIHSLMYYSRIVISSGDSMAREGAMLGVPSIYCGQRMMKVNDVLIQRGLFFKVKPDEVPDLVDDIIGRKVRLEEQIAVRANLFREWIDVNEFIIHNITKYEKKILR